MQPRTLKLTDSFINILVNLPENCDKQNILITRRVFIKK